MFGVGIKVKPGDYVLFGSNGGGGVGKPLDRDPILVCEDVADELISVKKAREIYGVAVFKDHLEYKVDSEETSRLRRELAQQPPKIGYGPGEHNPDGMEINVIV